MSIDYDVVVIGGGPAGSTISTLLAQKGRKVALLEETKFPRYHIGESLVTGVMPILEELNVIEKIEKEGFMKKYGITLVWGDNNKPWTVRFGEAGPDNNAEHEYAYEVKREKFDHILLEHAKSSGVDVREEHKVKKIIFDEERCVGVRYRDNNKEEHELYAKYIVDASGQSAMMARHKKMIEYDSFLKNTAVWTYFEDARRYEGDMAGNIIIENTEDGWIWFIPFSNNLTSVGLVAPSVKITKKNKETILHEVISNSSEVKKMLTNAKQVEGYRTTKDWSYQATEFARNGFLMTGDAAGFIDPLFSTGVFLAMNSASLGAKTINELLEYPEKEKVLFKEYELKYKSFLNKVIGFVHYFYDTSRNKDEYFNKAQEIVTPIEKMTARQEFVYLISGLAGSHTLEKESINFSIKSKMGSGKL